MITLANLSELCAENGVRQFIISPGSRSAPLTIAFSRNPRLTCRVVPDERAAGFIALGLAQQTGQPTGLICTSGTAAANYIPAVIEAFYQRVPLLILTADRPPEWIDQQDGQTIHQPDLYAPHCRGSFSLPADLSHPDAQWHAERLVSEAINRALWPAPGPVHLNIPRREPLYPPPGVVYAPRPGLKPIRLARPQLDVSPADWPALRAEWQSAGRKLIVAGLYPPEASLAAALAELLHNPTVAVLADVTANLPPAAGVIRHADTILGAKSADLAEPLTPDLLVSFGGPVVSKTTKLFLRHNRPANHWHLDPAGAHVDTFQALTRVLPVDPANFLRQLAQQPATAGLYQRDWQAREDSARQALSRFWEQIPFGEFAAVRQILRVLPAHSRLQLGNSMAVRYAAFIGPDECAPGISVNGNRGASGIDGSVSTAVGAALATEQITTLICGDLAFFYDRNALWHAHVPANLRVVILNNHGGGIFKLIDGPASLPPAELETYFFTPQPLTAKNTAADHGCDYFFADDESTLREVLPAFFAPRSRPAILEIETDSAVNAEVFKQFKAIGYQLSVDR